MMVFDGTASEAGRIVWAQTVLDQHVTSSATGHCLDCGRLGPCAERGSACLVFYTSPRLPRRQPFATRPDLLDPWRAGLPAAGVPFMFLPRTGRGG
jgi:hypothetical protein